MKEFEKNIESFVKEANSGKKEHKPMRVIFFNIGYIYGQNK